jgi:hypothetical protein
MVMLPLAACRGMWQRALSYDARQLQQLAQATQKEMPTCAPAAGCCCQV